VTAVVPPLEVVERLLLAGVLGALIGAEREWRQKDAGLRTNTLISIGSALFTLAAIELAGSEPSTASRIPAQVASGVGFIGGGAILRGRGNNVHGLTTAATIWVNAAIGMAAGAGAYALAAIAGATVLFVLTAFLPLQRYLEKRAREEHPEFRKSQERERERASEDRDARDRTR
jgi:putative Mg2+ transporter-C (MgtC) family protein